MITEPILLVIGEIPLHMLPVLGEEELNHSTPKSLLPHLELLIYVDSIRPSRPYVYRRHWLLKHQLDECYVIVDGRGSPPITRLHSQHPRIQSLFHAHIGCIRPPAQCSYSFNMYT